MLPYLLAALAEATYTNACGETLSGRILTDAAAVIYAGREDHEAACELSRVADVRIAWGGREAIEAIVNLPRRYGTEDIVFGPKLSLAIVGADAWPMTTPPDAPQRPSPPTPPPSTSKAATRRTRSLSSGADM